MSTTILCVCLQLFVQELVQQLYHKPVKVVCSHHPDKDNSVHQHQNGTQHHRKPHSHPTKTRLNADKPGLGVGEQTDLDTSPHPNLSSLLVALESCHAFYFLYPYLRFTLFDVVMHTPTMLEDSVAKPLFVLYQLLSVLEFCHVKGATLGQIGLRNVFMDARLWIQMRLPLEAITSPLSSAVHAKPKVASRMAKKGKNQHSSISLDVGDVVRQTSKVMDLDVSVVDTQSSSEGVSCDNEIDHVFSSSSTPLGSLRPSQAGSTHTLIGLNDHSLPTNSPWCSPSYHHPTKTMLMCEATLKWRNGELSNFDYLLLLNHHAGRVPGDPNNHPIFPWVMDFTHRDGGYRDLSKSKYRLNKGDQQLDFTYISAHEEMRMRGSHQDGLVPHHIGDISSEVTYYVYLARKISKVVLCSRVRPQWVPEEYPTSLEKMYIWTPDECIPEFFTDPSLFRSIHPDLPDLALPGWATSPEDVISVHRAVLEGDIVSANLHYWIDIMFGYKLTGHDAVRSKNVYVSLVDKHKEPKNHGIVQLFKSSHPKRIQSSSAPLTVFEWNSYLSMSSVRNSTHFNIHQPLPQDAGLSVSSSPALSAVHTRGGSGGSPVKNTCSPKANDQKTLESIIGHKNAPILDNISGSDVGQENQEDDFTGSFEHVNMDDVKDSKLLAPSSTTNASTSNGSSTGRAGEVVINYSDIPVNSSAMDSGKLVPPQVKSRSESLVVVPPAPTGKFRNPVVMMFSRQRKANTTETEIGLEKHQGVSLPKEANFMQRLTKLEEMAHFAMKSCRDDGDIFQKMWDPDKLPLFDVSSLCGVWIV